MNKVSYVNLGELRVSEKKINLGTKKNKEVFVKESDLIGDIISVYPEAVPVLFSVGLHCVGCHVSVSESLKDGCLVHGFSEKQIKELVNELNKKIILVNNLPQVLFKKKAVNELISRAKKQKTNLVRIIHSFGGEFDFEPTKKTEKNELTVFFNSDKEKLGVVVSSRIERMLRGVEIDYDLKIKDFVAKRTQTKNN